MKKTVHIGICYDHPDEYPEVQGPADRFAEFEPDSTIQVMEDAIRYVGHRPIRLGGPRALVQNRPDVDVIWNIAEGLGTRNREAWVPILCELYRIPCLGSDAFTLSQSLDKVTTKQIARQSEIPTSDWLVITYGSPIDETILENAVKKHLGVEPWPVFVKPRYEGTGKGITPSSVCRTINELLLEIARQSALYVQDLIVEPFLSGPEYTVAVSGTPLKAHPVLERGLDAETHIGMHIIEAYRARTATQPIDLHAAYTLSHQLSFELEARLRTWSLRLCSEMQILDYARLDFKLNHLGNPYFLEVNPLPTFATDNTFAILAELNDQSYTSFLGEILRGALQRSLIPV